MRETELYPPVKAFLERQGYSVKAEVEDCDVVARRGDEPPVIVELKLALNIELLLQGVDRQRMTDAVYLAVPDDRSQSRKTLLRRSEAEVLRLVRMLGLGLLVVRFRGGARGSTAGATVEALADPGPFRPRKQPDKRRKLLAEFDRLRADYNVGGSNGRRMTAYRQDALACVLHLQASGVQRPAAIRSATGVVRAGRIVYDNHYGWFERLGGGEYRVSERGVAALDEYAEVVNDLSPLRSPDRI